MTPLFLFDFACSLRVIDRQAPLAAAPRMPFSAPDPLKGRRGVGITFNHRATRGRFGQSGPRQQRRGVRQLLGHCPSLHWKVESSYSP